MGNVAANPGQSGKSERQIPVNWALAAHSWDPVCLGSDLLGGIRAVLIAT